MHKNIHNVFFNDVTEITRHDVESRFPHLQNRGNARVIKMSFPFGVESSDNGIKRILETNAVKNKVHLLKDMPVHYASDDAGLPEYHDDGDKENKPEVGHILEASIENKNVIVYALLHPQTQKEATELIQANKEMLGCSWEILPKKGEVDEAKKTQTITDFDWIGIAILAKEHAAYPDSKIMVANKEKGEKEMAEEKKEVIRVIDEKILQENIELKSKLNEIEKIKTEVEKKEELEKIKKDAESKTKEAQAQAEKIQKELDDMKKSQEKKEKEQKEEEEKKRVEESQEKAKKRAEELKDFISKINDETKKSSVLSFLEKATDDEYDLFKEGKTAKKEEPKGGELLTSRGAGSFDYSSAERELPEVSDDELIKVYGKVFK